MDFDKNIKECNINHNLWKGTEDEIREQKIELRKLLSNALSKKGIEATFTNIKDPEPNLLGQRKGNGYSLFAKELVPYFENNKNAEPIKMYYKGEGSNIDLLKAINLAKELCEIINADNNEFEYFKEVTNEGPFIALYLKDKSS